MKLLAAVLLCVTIAPACTPGIAVDSVAGRTFVADAVIDGGTPRPLVPGTEIRLEFSADGTLRATAGCNSIGGAYSLEGEILRFESGATTAIGCDPARHAQDEWLTALLAAGPNVTLAGDRLELRLDSTVLRMVDREVADPDRPLTGTLWTLEAIRQGDVVSSVPGSAATIRIADDGTAEISTGCNSGRARVAVDGDVIRFSDLRLTRRGCPPDLAAVEVQFLLLESADLRWSIDADRLTLDGDDIGVELRAAG